MAQFNKIQSFGEHHEQNMKWARQSICWALSIKAQSDGRPLDAVEDVEVAHARAFELASKLWTNTVKELGSKLTPSSANFTFAKNVMDWCAQEIGYKPPPAS